MSTTETKIKEKGIPFKAPMVQAILDGRQTQTRRIIEPQPVWVGECSVPFRTPDADPSGVINCPYGSVGERLWVKETARVESETTGLDPWHSIEYAAGGSKVQRGRLPGKWFPSVSRNKDQSQRWHPSIFMPRWASRITLEITDVRVERLNDISEADAYAEGVTIPSHYRFASNGRPEDRNEARVTFETLWESINGPGSWALNPWVWVIEFKRISSL